MKISHRLNPKLAALCAAALLAGASLLSLPASAHHGWSGYFEDVTVQATVTKVVFGNPHDRLIVEDATGQTWNLLLAPPYRNRDFGYDASIFAEGQQVEFVGQRQRGRFEAKIHFINDLAGNNIYTYYYDSGITSWEREHGTSSRRR